MPDLSKIKFIELEEYLSKENRQETKESQLKKIDDEYKGLLDEYMIDVKLLADQYDDTPLEICDYCKKELSTIRIPNVKGEYKLCLNDKILYPNMSQVLRLFNGWTIKRLFDE